MSNDQNTVIDSKPRKSIWGYVAFLCAVTPLVLGNISNEMFNVKEYSAALLSYESRGLEARNFSEPKHEDVADLKGKVLPYSQTNISRTANYFKKSPFRILAFDGEQNCFNAYSLTPYNNSTRRAPKYQDKYAHVVPLLVDAMRSNFPERFATGSPSFQMAFMASDYIDTDCVNHPEECPASSFIPILAFGSVPKDPEVLPTVQGFPLPFYLQCLFNWRSENLEHRQNCPDFTAYSRSKDFLPWEDLYKQIIWRGTDDLFAVSFDGLGQLKTTREVLSKRGNVTTKDKLADALLNKWDRITPRSRAVGLSLLAEIEASEEMAGKKTKTWGEALPWINAKFVIHPKSPFNRKNPLTRYILSGSIISEEAVKYRYQIDLGGPSGTESVIYKLALPSLLFHHETRAKDWPFDELKPWRHYVPVREDLSDLFEKFEWAEANPDRAEHMAKAGTKFAIDLMSKEHMRATFEKYYKEYLGRVVEAYQPATNENIKLISKRYKKDGFEMIQFAECKTDRCSTKTTPGAGWHHSLPLGSAIQVEMTKKSRLF